MGAETQSAIERLGSNVVSFDLKFERTDTQLPTGFFY